METLGGLNDHRTSNTQHNGPVEPTRDRETRGGHAQKEWTLVRFTRETLIDV